MQKLLITPKNPNGILIDLTADEIAQKEQDVIQAQADKIAKEQKITQEKLNKQSALNKLFALGLTADEIKAIIG